MEGTEGSGRHKRDQDRFHRYDEPKHKSRDGNTKRMEGSEDRSPRRWTGDGGLRERKNAAFCRSKVK
jgi:hypothetical protein